MQSNNDTGARLQKISLQTRHDNPEIMSLSTPNLGDAFHMVNILGILVYGTTLFLLKDGDFFDPSWLKEGFCIHQHDVPFWTTHDLSGYAMLAISIFGLLLLLILKKVRLRGTNAPVGMEMANKLAFWALIGAIGHGGGHLLITNAKRNGTYPVGDMRGLDALLADKGAREIILRIVRELIPGYLLFWVPLVKTYMINTPKNKVILLAALIQIGAMQLQAKFAFAFTQMVFFAGLSFDQLLFVPQTDKGFEYALWPLVTVIPSTALSWWESTSCTTSVIMRDYGHVIYDTFMASSYILYYLICLVRIQRSERNKLC